MKFHLHGFNNMGTKKNTEVFRIKARLLFFRKDNAFPKCTVKNGTTKMVQQEKMI